MRPRVCDHLYACVREDGLAIDGGEPIGCTMTPCDECGALCPGSTWTSEYARLDAAQEVERARGRQAKVEDLITRYLVWRDGE